ncbi:MAG: vitamin K epoxide reductase family protein [Patescibacteria group bacterium]
MKKSLPFIILSSGGFIDSLCLTFKYYLPDTACIIGSGCHEVMASAYATIGEMPLAGFGLLYYGTILFLSLLYFQKKLAIIIKIIFALSLVGTLISAYLVYLQIFVIKAICAYCFISAILSLSIFLVSIFMIFSSRNVKNENIRAG